MKKILVCLMLLLPGLYCCSQTTNQWRQAEDSIFAGKVYKWEGNIKYYFNSDINLKDRNAMIRKCKRYIKDNLKLINESELKDDIHIIFIKDREEMYRYVFERMAGTVVSAAEAGENMVFSVYANGINPVKHELMHIINICKWGEAAGGTSLAWLSEGLATYCDPATECDGYSFEEKYVAFLQSGQLADIGTLLHNFRDTETYREIKIRYNQSAYIVQYIVDNYGMNKVKELWQGGMRNFTKIFGIEMGDMLTDINDMLNDKYPSPIRFDWDRFEERCF